MTTRASTRLRSRLASGALLPAAGIYDALSAAMARHAGFEAAVLGGFSLMAASAGLPDVGIETRTEVVDATRRIAAAVDIPLLVDASEGYGGPSGVFHTVAQLQQAGAAGILLGDQTSPAICPMLGPPDVIPVEQFVAKIAVALEARSDPNMLIVARTDAAARYGADEAIARAQAYRDAGADMILPVAGIPRDKAGLQGVIRRIDAPVFAPSAHDIGLTFADYAEIGAVMTGGLEGLFSAAEGLYRAFEELQRDGIVSDPERRSGSPAAIEWMSTALGWRRWLDLECRF